MISAFKISPGGQRLLIINIRRFDDNQLYVMNTDGSGLKNLVSDASYTSDSPTRRREVQYCWRLHASWSPTGSRIAVYNQDPTARVLLYTIAPDGSEVQELITRDFAGNLIPLRGESVIGDFSQYSHVAEYGC